MASKIKKTKKVNEFSSGYMAGQRKLAFYLTTLEINNLEGLRWLLNHLEEVSKGREIIDNSIIGFTSIENV